MKIGIAIAVGVLVAITVMGNMLADEPVAYQPTTTEATTTTTQPTTTTVPEGPDFQAMAEATCTAFETLYLPDMMDVLRDSSWTEYEGLQFIIVSIVKECPEQMEQLVDEIYEFYPQYVDRIRDELGRLANPEGVTA